jgi:hypothetical protein
MRPNTNCSAESVPSSNTDVSARNTLSALHGDVLALVDERVIEIIPRRFYEHMEAVARRRVPRDPYDWPPVALALVLDAGILTADHDFLGCGCPTWTAETLWEALG